MAIELYPHNQETYEKMTEMFKTSNRVGAVQPTGTGKSFLMLKWIEDHPNDSFIVISPSLEIFMQLVGYAKETDDENLLRSVRMISYQTLIRMSNEEIANQHAQKIIVDEFHRAGAGLWGPALLKLLDANPQAKVFGASATPIRYLDNGRDMASELFDRNLAVQMTLGEAVRRGILPPPMYVPVWYDIDGKLKQYAEDISNIEDKDKRKELEEKLAWMKRRLENSYGAEGIFRKHMPHDHGKFLVFCRDIDHLEEMKKVLPRWLASVNRNVRFYVSISVQEDKDLQLQAFKEDNGDDAVKLLFTIDRLNEGVHVKGIDGVIMMRPTISPIIYLQQMGRALASGGKTPLVFDLVNNYQNVQVPTADGKNQNVFEREFRGDGGSEVEVGDFRIFEDMMAFTALFDVLESVLYPDNEEVWERHLQEYLEFLKKNGREPLRTGSTTEEKILGEWANKQRVASNKGNLSFERKEQLIKIGFVFDPVDSVWQHTLQEYVAFINNHLREPSASGTTKEERSLGQWKTTQRISFKKGNLSQAHIEQLCAIYFDFDPYESAWQNGFRDYVCFKAIFQREPSKSCISEDEKRLHSWAIKQRCEKQSGKLSLEHEQQLISIGFDFAPLETAWLNTFQDYILFKKSYGREPSSRGSIDKEKALADWATSQRKLKRKGRLSPVREQQLVSAGFDFDPLETDWQNNLQDYILFKKSYGREPSSRGSIDKEKKLATWAKLQRTKKCSGELSLEHERQLLETGFDFKLNTLEDKIQSASARATDSHFSGKAPVKEVTPER